MNEKEMNKYTKEKVKKLGMLILHFAENYKRMDPTEGAEQCRDFIESIIKEAHPELMMKLATSDQEKNKLDIELKRLRKKVICLCGSTRFTELMLVKQWELTKQGYVVLSWCALPDSYFDKFIGGKDRHHIGDQEGVKEIADEVHMRKIDLADEVLILNVNGYIGESTQNELDYAIKMGKAIKYLERIK